MQHHRDRRPAGCETEIRTEAVDQGAAPRRTKLQTERIATTMTEHSDDLLHIASCRTCRDRFTAHNVATLPDDRRGEPGRMREFLETARRLERERDGVEDLVARLVRRTPPSHWDALANAPELRSAA